MSDYDLCVIGSGAGAGPVVYEAARAGRSVLVLEKGPWFTEADFYKDELAALERSVYRPSNREQPHVIVSEDAAGQWVRENSGDPGSGRDWWNGNCVGGSSNFMSGYFYRLKPDDFRLRSVYGPIEGANVADWPIGYEALEPWYTHVEQVVGVSGRVRPHPHAEPRSTPDFPFPPTHEHVAARWIDTACEQLGLPALVVPRAILSRPAMGRRGCEYSGFCGNYGCASGAKGGARAALLNHAVATGHCEIRPHAQVYRLESDRRGRVLAAHYYDRAGQARRVDARVFVIACQAVESVRLMLLSTGPRHPEGLGNRYGQVGRNMVFCGGGSGGGFMPFDAVEPAVLPALKAVGPFVNRGLQAWYQIDDPAFGGRAKGGTIDFLMESPSYMPPALAARYEGSRLVWGRQLKRRLESMFLPGRMLRFEVFCDWLPNDQCRVSLDPEVRDRWGLPVARIQVGQHPRTLQVARYLIERALPVVEQAGFRQPAGRANLSPPTNLQGGGCRFGTDPRHSVLDAHCRVHDAENVYVTDGSFMPTGGSAPFTWTIYANAFRVARHILSAL